MSGTTVCSLCGTVNVGDPIRCIACGQELGADDASAAQNAPSQRTGELGEAARQPTIVDAVPGDLARTDAVTGAVKSDTDAVTSMVAAAAGAAARPGKTSTDTETSDVESSDAVRYIVRLLLPDGDRRSVEIGTTPIPLGSGLDELGLTGDPRVGSCEAHLQVDGDTLYVNPESDAQSIYRRLRAEETLSDGDVVLMGDVAAKFEHVPPGNAVDGATQVLGGSANTPIGRLIFLRRDGSDGPLHDLPAGKTVVGRTDGHLNFPKDSRLSRRHARFYATEVGVSLEDLGSRNGTYLRVRRRTPLQPGDALRVGSAGVKVRGQS